MPLDPEKAFEERIKRNMALRRLCNQINAWSDRTRAELEEYREREKMRENPNWGRF